LKALGHRWTEKDLGLANQFAFHVGDHAVEIES
jgi:hypothetical protein